MIGAMIVLAAASAELGKPREACAIAVRVLRDVSRTDRESRLPTDRFVDTRPAEGRASTLLACPDLARHLPHGLKLAGPAEASYVAAHQVPRADDPVPVRYVDIFSVSLPELSQDGQSATVSIEKQCVGLCGSGFKWRYDRHGGRWVRAAPGMPDWVS